MTVVIVGSGPADELPDLHAWPEAAFIGVDAGALVLIGQGISPKAAVGDFDSVTPSQLEEIVSSLPGFEKAEAEKDETDTELALAKALEFSPRQVVITGVTGGRLDHYMSALHAVYAAQLKHPEIGFSIINKQNRIRFLPPGTHTLERDAAYRFVSFYPFGEEVKGFTLRHFKYEVADETVPFGSTRFVSNELEKEGTVSFVQGQCMVIESRD